MKIFYSLINRVFFILILGIICSSLNAQITSQGKDFWMGFMPNYPEENPFTKLYITSQTNASGTITIPGKSWSVNFNVTANSTAEVDIPLDKSISAVNETVVNNGIHIVANNDVNVFAMNFARNTSDGTLVLPVNALGSSYYAMSYQPSSVALESEFLIVAVEDNTNIRIYPSNTTKNGKPQFAPFDIQLNKGEVYLVQSPNDLTGSLITSIGTKKPFAVYSGNLCVNVPANTQACNHLYEQLYPISTWRRNYLAIPYLTRTGDTYKIIASKSGTIVSINGANVVTLNAGQSYETIISNPSTISANFPISVAQFSNGHGYDNVNSDPFMIMLSPIEQTRTDLTFEVFSYPTIKGNYLNISASTSCTSNILLDGAPVTGWNTFPSNPAYSFTRLTLPTQGTHHLKSTNDDCGFTAYVYGYGDYDSYGYSAGVALDTLSVSFTAYTNCVGKETDFFVKSQPYTILNYNWTFGDGGKATIANPKYKYTKAGQYQVRLIVQYDDNSLDTVYQNVTISGIKADFTVSGGGCVREIQVDNASVGIFDSYLSCNWLFGDGGSAKGNSVKHTYAKAGNYQVKIFAESANHCFDTLTKIVKIFDPPQPVITPLGPTLFCTCDSVVLDAGNLGYVSYLWSNGATSQKIIVKTANTFTVTVIDTNGCKNTSPSVSTQTISPNTSISFLEPIISISTGKQFKYNVILKPESNINICKIKNYRAVISYKKTIFVPAGNTAPGTMDNFRRYFEISGSWNGRDSLIATLDFLATLGDSVAGDIRIDSFAWTECDLPSTKGTSIVVLDDLCKEGGITRLFKSDNKAIYLSVIPNPVGKDAIIEFDIKKKDYCKIDLYDLLGNKVKEIFTGNVEPGIQNIKLNSMELTNGSYYLIINAGEISTKQLIEVQK